jgi:hypothetical protein
VKVCQRLFKQYMTKLEIVLTWYRKRRRFYLQECEFLRGNGYLYTLKKTQKDLITLRQLFKNYYR